MIANYATEAGYAKSAGRASESERSINSNYAVIAKEAERLNVGAHQIVIVAEGHQVLFLTPNLNPEECVILDLDKRALMNVAQISDPEGNLYSIVPPQ
jgi:hypothetical protein